MGFNSFVDVVNWYRGHGVIDKLADMVVADALILNQDRHLGNFGGLSDARLNSLNRIINNQVKLLLRS